MEPENSDAEKEVLSDNDEVEIDVTDLTNIASNIQKSISSLIGSVDKIEQKIKDMDIKNTKEISSIKKEIEERNPTDKEKMELRTVKSNPFTDTPQRYWDDKTKNSNYEVSNGDNEKEYVLTDKDVIDGYNQQDIAKTFDDDLSTNFDRIFGF